MTALADLVDQGTLVKASIRATGYDLTTVPPDGVPVPLTPLSESPAA